MNQTILPEGRYLDTEENRTLCSSLQGLKEAMSQNLIVEGIALCCEEGYGITVDLGNFQGFIPWEEGALGLSEGFVREIAILTRVGRPVSVVITDLQMDSEKVTPILSRRKAQETARNQILALGDGTVLPATVTRLENFGAFVDVGCGIASLLSIDRISISRIRHPKERFQVGQELYVVILEHDWDALRIRVSHRELLGTWEENRKRFSVGMTLTGVVRSIKSYGIFVELAPNFSGLAESTEGIKEGDRVSVYMKGLHEEKMKCKLLIIGLLPPTPPQAMEYVLPPSGKLEQWSYPPSGCVKLGGTTVFTKESSLPTCF